MNDYKEVRTTQHEQGHEQRVATFKATQWIWLLLGIIEALIALRVIFKLIGVNGSNAFASLLYNVSNFFVAPFASLTGAPSSSGMVLEISSILAMIIYLLIGWGIERIVYTMFYRPRGPVTTSQTVVSDHNVPLAPSQTVITDRTTTQAPLSSTQTTTTEQTKTLN